MCDYFMKHYACAIFSYRSHTSFHSVVLSRWPAGHREVRRAGLARPEKQSRENVTAGLVWSWALDGLRLLARDMLSLHNSELARGTGPYASRGSVRFKMLIICKPQGCFADARAGGTSPIPVECECKKYALKEAQVVAQPSMPRSRGIHSDPLVQSTENPELQIGSPPVS